MQLIGYYKDKLIKEDFSCFCNFNFARLVVDVLYKYFEISERGSGKLIKKSEALRLLLDKMIDKEKISMTFKIEESYLDKIVIDLLDFLGDDFYIVFESKRGYYTVMVDCVEGLESVPCDVLEKCLV